MPELLRLRVRWTLETPAGARDLGLNDVTTAGVANMLNVTFGLTGGTPLSAANAYLGVGDANTAFSVGQTDLQAATNKVRVGMDGGFPSRTGPTVTLRSTFVAGTGTFAWNEWGLFYGSAGANMFSRRVQALGTKPAGVPWTLTATLALA